MKRLPLTERHGPDFLMALRRFSLGLSLMVVMGCQLRAPTPPLPLGNQGEVDVYLAGAPASSDRVRFTLKSLAVVDAQGRSVPLNLHLHEIRGETLSRQHLLASGRVPSGSYRGLSVGIGRAWITGEQGESNLLVPEEPVKVTADFTVPRGAGILVVLHYQQEGSLPQSFRFAPCLTAELPMAPVVDRIGFVSGRNAGYVTVFDRKTLQVTGLISFGLRPTGVVFDTNLKRAYVALAGEDAIEVVDLLSMRMLGRIPLQVGDRPQRLALSGDGTLLLSANAGSNTVSFIDPRAFGEIYRLRVGNDPEEVLIDPDGRRAYVFNRHESYITVIDLAGRSVLAQMPTESGPIRGAFDGDGKKLYVIHRESPYLLVFDTQSLQMVGRLYIGMGYQSILVDPDTGMVYLSRKGAKRIDIYDPFSLLPIDFLSVPGSAKDMVIDRKEDTLLLAIPGSPAMVAAVDLVNRQIVGRMDVGSGPFALALMGAIR